MACKTSRVDSFPIGWYKTFINLLVLKLCQLYDRIFDKGSLSVFNQTYIIVIPKTGKDHTVCQLSFNLID